MALTIFGHLPFHKSLIWFSCLETPAWWAFSLQTSAREESGRLFPEAVVCGPALPTGCAESPPGSQHPLITQCPAGRFLSSPSHFPDDHIGCILARPDRISSIHDASSLMNSLRFVRHSSSECPAANTGHTGRPGEPQSPACLSLSRGARSLQTGH